MDFVEEDRCPEAETVSYEVENDPFYRNGGSEELESEELEEGFVRNGHSFTATTKDRFRLPTNRPVIGEPNTSIFGIFLFES